MVRYNQLYHGSTHIGYISKNGQIVKKVYKGSELIYQLGFDPVTFNVSSSLQTFTVPLGVSKIHVDCVASKGQTVTSGGYTGVGGNGGRVQCDLSVNGGETLYIMVGGVPTSGATPNYNASDIRLGGNTLNNRIIVAGGGGSGAVANHYRVSEVSGGAGGGLTGGIGTSHVSYLGSASPAAGGTQSAGGSGAGAYCPYTSYTGNQGDFGLGGAGNGNVGIAGAGGAGYYGGGGSATSAFADEKSRNTAAGGSGGGSSYTNANCSNVVHTQGYQDGAGYVTISFVS